MYKISWINGYEEKGSETYTIQELREFDYLFANFFDMAKLIISSFNQFQTDIFKRKKIIEIKKIKNIKKK